MTDLTLRLAERAHGQGSAEHLRARMRAGDLDHGTVEFAAYVGSEAAREVLGWAVRSRHDGHPDGMWAGWPEWLAGLPLERLPVARREVRWVCGKCSNDPANTAGGVCCGCMSEPAYVAVKLPGCLAPVLAVAEVVLLGCRFCGGSGMRQHTITRRECGTCRESRLAVTAARAYLAEPTQERLRAWHRCDPQDLPDWVPFAFSQGRGETKRDKVAAWARRRLTAAALALGHECPDCGVLGGSPDCDTQQPTGADAVKAALLAWSEKEIL